MNADLRDALVRLIPNDARVLEVGCGWGDLWQRCPKRCGLVSTWCRRTSRRRDGVIPK